MTRPGSILFCSKFERALRSRKSISKFELCLVLETMSFEFMLSRSSSAIAGALRGRYPILKGAQLELRTPTAERRCAAAVTRSGGG